MFSQEQITSQPHVGTIRQAEFAGMAFQASMHEIFGCLRSLCFGDVEHVVDRYNSDEMPFESTTGNALRSYFRNTFTILLRIVTLKLRKFPIKRGPCVPSGLSKNSRIRMSSINAVLVDDHNHVVRLTSCVSRT